MTVGADLPVQGLLAGGTAGCAGRHASLTVPSSRLFPASSQLLQNGALETFNKSCADAASSLGYREAEAATGFLLFGDAGSLLCIPAAVAANPKCAGSLGTVRSRAYSSEMVCSELHFWMPVALGSVLRLLQVWVLK